MGQLSTLGFVKLWQGRRPLATLLPAILLAFALVPFASVRPDARMIVGVLGATVGVLGLLRDTAPAARGARIAAALAALAWLGSSVAFLDAGPALRGALQPGIATALERSLAEAGATVRPLALDPWRALVELGHLAGLLLLAMGTSRLVRDDDDAGLLARGLLAVGVLVVITAVVHRLGHAPSIGWVTGVPETSDEPFFAPFVSPNHGAAACAALLPLAVALAWSAAGLRRWLALGAAGVLVGGLLIAHSRAGWLDAGVALAVLAALAGGRRARVGLVGLLSAGALAVAVAGPERTALWLTEQVTPETSAVIEKGYTDVLTGRGQIYAEAVDLIRAAPWVGVGPGGFDDGYQFVKRELNYRFASHAHQEFLQLCAEHGVPIALLWVGLVIVLAVTLTRDAAGRGSARESLWIAAFSGTVAALLTDSLVDFPLRIGALAVLFFVGAGAAAGLLRPDAPLKAGQQRVAMLGLGLLALTAVAAPVRAVDLQDQLRHPWAPAEEAEARGDRLISEAIAAERTGGRDSPFRASLTQAALEMYQEALLREPVRWRTLLKLARLRGSTGDREGAFRALEVTTSVFPALPWAWLDMARFRRRAGEAVAADEAWRRFLLSDLPDDTDIDALMVEAIGEGPTLARAAAVLPERADRWIAAARLAEQRDEDFAAEILLRRAAEIAPEAGVELGAALLRWDRPDEAKVALEATPPTCRVHLLAGDALLEASLPAEAATHFQAAIQRCESKGRRARLGLATARVAQQDPAGLPALLSLAEEDPRDARTIRLLVEALDAAGRKDEAESWRKTLRAQRGAAQSPAE